MLPTNEDQPTPGKKYDVALSFAGEDREHAERLANLLKSGGRSVFYDKFEEAELWGKDLAEHLARVYGEQARYCVVFVSAHYPGRMWPRYEQDIAHGKAVRQKSEYVLPVRVDDTQIPGIPSTVAYLDLRHTPIEMIARLLLEKLEDGSGVSRSDILRTAMPDDPSASTGEADTLQRSPIAAIHPDPRTPPKGPHHSVGTGSATAATENGPSHLRRTWVVVGAACVAVIAVTAATAFLTTRSPGGGAPETSAPATMPVASSPAPASACVDTANGMTFVQPQTTTAGTQSGLTFCPVHINGGRLPMTGKSFDLAGQVLGPTDRRAQVLLINHDDPHTCDALGNAAIPGSFLISQADIGASDGHWSYTDPLGYDEAITYARNYSYVIGPPDALSAIKNDRQDWNKAHPGQAGDYPGINFLPPDAQVLATFDVPAGKYPGARPCKSA